MQVTITTYEVGQKFACAAKVVAASNGRKLHVTRDFPYGFDAQAYRAAEMWAQDNGHIVSRSEDE